MKSRGDYLTEAEAAALTGETEPALQAAALARSGVPFIFSGSAVRVLRVVASGRPRIQPSAGAPTPGGAGREDAEPEPN